MSYIGPAPKGTSVYLSGTGTGDGSTVAFAMGFTARADAEVIVTLDGVTQHTSAYTVSGSTCTFSAAPASGVAIEFRILQSLGFVAEIGDGTVNQSKIDSGALSPIVQVVRTDDGAVATGTTLIPYDDTIPQNTEGDEYITVTITPKSATNKLVIEAGVHLVHTAAGQLSAALFQDSTADALAATGLYIAANERMVLRLDYEMVAGTTSATTFKIRAGGAGAGTTTYNGYAGARYYGGIINSYLKVTEIAQ